MPLPTSTAARYAKQVLLNPDMLAAYTAKAEANGNVHSPRILAMTDFLTPPWITEINLVDFNGNEGDIIRVVAGDDFMVTEVTLKILAPGGSELEAGACEFNATDGVWQYTVTTSISIEPGLEIRARARDYPNHTGEDSYTYE